MTAWTAIQLVHAVNAFPRPIAVKQADGSTLTIVIKGNEYGRITTTTDGYPLWYNDETGNFEYATLNDGDIVGSGIVAADADKRSDIDNAFLSTLESSNIINTTVQKAAVNRAKSATTRALINEFPTIGEIHSLVILAEFSDLKFSTVGDDPQKFYTRMLNEEGFTYSNGANGSARDYYVDNSNGKFQPTFDVVGPVTVSNTMRYYGANSGGSDNYTRIAEMITEACTLAHDNYGVDFSKYDLDGDGQVDNVYVVYAGYGESDTGNTNTIWPHAAYLVNNLYSKFELDNKQIDRYTCCNEIDGLRRGQPVGIGLFVHEFTHVLGLADHYDIYSSSTAYTPDSYDLMDSGSYNNDSNTPPLLSAYERNALGWLDLTELTADESVVKTLPELGASNKAYRVSVPGNDNEYYVLENRQQKGWDAYLPGHGMLMWHIDYDYFVWLANTVNTVASHQRVDIVEADNRRTDSSRDGDTFPGASNVTSWEMDAWDGTKLASLDDIKETDGNIELVLGGMDYKLETPTITISNVEYSSATISWNEVPNADKYLFDCFEDYGELEEESNTKTYEGITSVTVDSLQPETNYAVILRAKRGSYVSEWAIANFTTPAIPFAKKKPTDVVVSNVQQNSFDVAWSGINDSKEYEVTLAKQVYDSSKTVTTGYDFSNQEAGMPEQWEYQGVFLSMNGYYGESAPSLRFSRNGGYLTVAYPEKMISGVSFWGRGGSNVDGTIHIECYKDGEWTDAATFQPTSEAQNHSFTFTPCEKVRISIDSNSGVYYIDDVVATCVEMERQIVSTQLTSDTSLSFSNLEGDATYGVTVVAISNDGERSATSDEVVVDMEKGETGIAPVIISNGDNATNAIYDLGGRKLDNSSSLPSGIYIIKKDGKTEKVNRK